MSCHVSLHSHMDTKHRDCLKKVGFVASVKAVLHFSCHLQQPSPREEKNKKNLSPASGVLGAQVRAFINRRAGVSLAEER